MLAGGDADAVRAADGIARDAWSFNRQLHVEEVRRIRELAKDFAEQQGISEQEARQLLLAQAMRTVDRAYGDTHADWDQAAETFLRRHATDTIEIDGTAVLMFTPGGEDGAFYEAPELLVETWGLFEEEFQQAYLATPLSLRSPCRPVPSLDWWPVSACETRAVAKAHQPGGFCGNAETDMART